MQGFATYASEYGPVRVDWQDDAVVRLRIIPQADYDADGAGETTGLTDETFRELEQYFAGELRRFTVPIAFASGTPVPAGRMARIAADSRTGETRTYAQIAEAVGHPKAVRAVGSANNRNPIPFIVPCHRVVGANGNLVGYAYGVEMKRSLLQMEMRTSGNDTKLTSAIV